MDIVPVQLATASAAMYHVIALLYKIELAGEHGIIDPSVLKEPLLGITLVINAYRQEGTRYGNCRSNADPKFTINNTKRSYDTKVCYRRV